MWFFPSQEDRPRPVPAPRSEAQPSPMPGPVPAPRSGVRPRLFVARDPSSALRPPAPGKTPSVVQPRPLRVSQPVVFPFYPDLTHGTFQLHEG